MDDKINIYKYEDYRLFLKDSYEMLKQCTPNLSHRAIAKRIGLKSPNFLQLVIQGKRDLGAEGIIKFSELFELDRDERYFFKYLVFLNQAKSVDERQLYASQIIKSKAFRRARPLAESQYKYFTHWYFVAIKELVARVDFKEDFKWIAARLKDKVSENEVEQALNELINLGQIFRNASGKLSVSKNVILSPDEVVSNFALPYHKIMIQKGIEAMSEVDRSKRDISCMTFGISQGNFAVVKEIVQRFRLELLSVLEQEENVRDVFQLNIQLFPLTQIDED